VNVPRFNAKGAAQKLGQRANTLRLALRRNHCLIPIGNARGQPLVKFVFDPTHGAFSELNGTREASVCHFFVER
jgi:hypothetical protein